ncbi:MAG: hypothetical protein M3M99_05835 [Actinomycetota bacterium]|nr:hypothetical protein [Actinomycetota bacterium]
MSAAITIAPVLNPMPTVPPRRIKSPPAGPVKERRHESSRAKSTEGGVAERPVVAVPQHMQALARANEVRLARAALKREVAAGRCSPIEVLVNRPWEADSMSIQDLLAAQRRWGKQRSRKLIMSTGIKETKELGHLTDRQRRILVVALEEKAA